MASAYEKYLNESVEKRIEEFLGRPLPPKEERVFRDLPSEEEVFLGPEPPPGAQEEKAAALFGEERPVSAPTPTPTPAPAPTPTPPRMEVVEEVEVEGAKPHPRVAEIWKKHADHQANQGPPVKDSEWSELAAMEADFAESDNPKLRRHKEMQQKSRDVGFRVLDVMGGGAGGESMIISRYRWKKLMQGHINQDVFVDLIGDKELPPSPTDKDLSNWLEENPEKFVELQEKKEKVLWQHVLATTHRGTFVETSTTTKDIIEGKGMSEAGEWGLSALATLSPQARAAAHGLTPPQLISRVLTGEAPEDLSEEISSAFSPAGAARTKEWLATSAPVAAARAVSTPQTYSEVATRQEFRPQGVAETLFNMAGGIVNSAASIVREMEVQEAREGEFSHHTEGFTDAVKEYGNALVHPVQTYDAMSALLRSENNIDYLRAGGNIMDTYPYLLDSAGEALSRIGGIREEDARMIMKGPVIAAMVGAIVIEPDPISVIIAPGAAAARAATALNATRKVNKAADFLVKIADTQGDDMVQVALSELQKKDYAAYQMVMAEYANRLSLRRPEKARHVLPSPPASHPAEYARWLREGEEEILEGAEEAAAKKGKGLSKAEKEREGLERAAGEGLFEEIEEIRGAKVEEAAANEENARAIWVATRSLLPKALLGNSIDDAADAIVAGVATKAMQETSDRIIKNQGEIEEIDAALAAIIEKQKGVLGRGLQEKRLNLIEQKISALRKKTQSPKIAEEIAGLEKQKLAIEDIRVPTTEQYQEALANMANANKKIDALDAFIKGRPTKPRPSKGADAATRSEAALRWEKHKEDLARAAGKKEVEGWKLPDTKAEARAQLKELKQQKLRDGGVILRHKELSRRVLTDPDGAKAAKRKKLLEREIQSDLNRLYGSGGIGERARAEAVFRGFVEAKEELIRRVNLARPENIGPLKIAYEKGVGYVDDAGQPMTLKDIRDRLSQLDEGISDAKEVLSDLGLVPEFLESTDDILREVLLTTADSLRQVAKEAKGRLQGMREVKLLDYLSDVTDETATVDKAALLRAIRSDKFLSEALEEMPKNSLFGQWADEPTTTSPPWAPGTRIVGLQKEMDTLYKRAAVARTKGLNLSRGRGILKIKTDDPTARLNFGEDLYYSFIHLLNKTDPAISRVGPYEKRVFDVLRAGQNNLAQVSKELSELTDAARWDSKAIDGDVAARDGLFQYLDTTDPVELMGGSLSFMNRVGVGTIYEQSRQQILRDLNLNPGIFDRLEALMKRLVDKAPGLQLQEIIIQKGDEAGKMVGASSLRKKMKDRGVEISQQEAEDLLNIVGTERVTIDSDIPLALKGLSRMWLASESPNQSVLNVAMLVLQARQTLLTETSFRAFASEMRSSTYRIMGASEKAEMRALSFGANAMSISYSLAATAKSMERALGGVLSAKEARSANALMAGDHFATDVDFEAGLAALNKMGAPLTLSTWSGSIGKIAEGNRRLVSLATADGGTAWLPKVIVQGIEDEAGHIIKELDRRSLPTGWGDEARNFVQSWKTSLVSGIGLPNPRYWTNNIVGDHSQIWNELGLLDATRLSFQNLRWNLPGIQRAQSKREEQLRKWVATLPKGRTREALGTITNALFNPYVNDLLRHGQGTLISRTGERIPKSQLRQELVEENITDTFVQEEILDHWSRQLRRSFEANRRAPRNTFTDRIERLSGRAGKWNRDLSYHASSVQQRQRVALYTDLRMKGASRQEAAKKTLDALYDWKHGATQWEMNTYFRYLAFARYHRNAIRQGMLAFTEPFTTPFPELMGKALTGRTRLARTRQQMTLWSGFPDLFDPQDPDQVDALNEMQDIAALKFPDWTDNRPTGWSKAAPVWMQDFYAYTQGGREVTHSFATMPSTTLWDTMDLMMGAGLGILGFTGIMEEAPGSLAPNWERHVWEPVLSTLLPAQEEAAAALLRSFGEDTGWAWSGKYVPVEKKLSATYNMIPGIAGQIIVDNQGREMIPAGMDFMLKLPGAGHVGGAALVGGMVAKKVPILRSVANPQALAQAIAFLQNQHPNLYKNIWGDNPHRWKENQDWLAAGVFAAGRLFAVGSTYYWAPGKEHQRDQANTKKFISELQKEMEGRARRAGVLKTKKIQPRTPETIVPEF